MKTNKVVFNIIGENTNENKKNKISLNLINKEGNNNVQKNHISLVIKDTKKNNNLDDIQYWIDNNLEMTENNDDFVTIKQLWDNFNKAEFNHNKIKLKQFRESIKKKLNKSIIIQVRVNNKNYNSVIKGVKIYEDEKIDEDEPLPNQLSNDSEPN